MAKIYRLKPFEKSRKRKERWIMRSRKFFFRLSLLINVLLTLYIAYSEGHLTNIIEQVAQLIESLTIYYPSF